MKTAPSGGELEERVETRRMRLEDLVDVPDAVNGVIVDYVDDHSVYLGWKKPRCYNRKIERYNYTIGLYDPSTRMTASERHGACEFEELFLEDLQENAFYRFNIVAVCKEANSSYDIRHFEDSRL